MIDSGKLLNQFLGQANGTKGNSNNGDLLKGAAAGGILGLLIGNKKTRKMAKGLVGYGGAAAAGALAYSAYKNWKAGNAPAVQPPETAAAPSRINANLLPDALDASGQSFGLTLITAMIGAAKADGHIDPQEQTRIFEQVQSLGLDSESKGFVFDLLNKPVGIDDIASHVNGLEQASEVYLVSCLAIDPDHPAEQAYLEALAHRLNLPSDLKTHIEQQLENSA